MQAQISLCAKIGYMYYCEYAHLLKKHTEHTCMSAIYNDQSSDIKADKCKTIVMFDTLLESKFEYSTYRILNRSELCECSLMAGNYLLSQAASNCGDMPEAKDDFFTTYYTFSWIVLNVLMEKFDIQVDEDTVTQSTLLHSDIPGYDLPAIDFLSPSEEAQESHILEEQDTMIYTHLEKVLVHMIDEQDAQIFKSIVTFIAFFLTYCKTMQAMLAAFITMNTSDIPPFKANPISRMFLPLFTINLAEEDQIIKDLEDIERMKTTIQVISFFVCTIVAIIILYQIFK